MDCVSQMMSLRLKLFQEMACYKKPFALKVAETYPLPPYSTVSGLMHNILKANSYVDMSISIQGNYEDKFINLQTYYFYKKNGKTKMPLNVHYLYNVELVIHVVSKKEVIEKLIYGIQNSCEFFSLGRKEDLLRIDEVKKVEIKEIDLTKEDMPLFLKYSAYVPRERYQINGLTGINYNLNFKYEIKNELRKWERIKTIFVEKSNNSIDNGTIYIDEDEIPVFLNLKVDEKYDLC